MKRARLLSNSLTAFAVAVPLVFATSASADRFPSVTGTWSGSHSVAFPRNHPQYPDQSLAAQMELEIYKQENNLFWAINRWRPDEASDWVVEYATGAFDLEDRDEFTITVEGPAAEDWINTGFFLGELDDGKFYLNRVGIGDGISFSTALSRQG